MANTVNDVMNVIASPDYGIKNIAGTNQEILAILSGIHNSKSNIYNLVNDVKLLLQNLVVASTTKKPVEVENKTAKINQKNIQNILLETESIRNAIENLAKAILKQGSAKSSPAIAKLSSKASDKVAEAMIKSIEKQNKGGGISALVDAFSKLKDISLKDLLLGNKKVKLIMKVFKNAQKDLKIDEKELNSIIKLINAAPEMMKALKKVSRRIDKIIKNNVIGKLKDILIGKNSLLTLSQSLLKYEKTFNKANKTAKDISEFATSLNKALKEIVFASLWSKFANSGVKGIETVIVDNLIPLSQKIIESKKDVDEGTKTAKNITALVGNLLVSSILLSISVVTAIPAILGAMALSILVDIVIPIAKKLSKNNKNISKAIGSALLFTAFTGIMLLSSYFLTKIAENGVETLLGSFVIMGVVLLNILTFKILGKATKNIIIGAIGMAIMSVSLILFGIALGKITEATKDVTWNQFGMIAALTVLLGGVVAILGIPAVAPFILLGAVSMAVMSVSLLLFGIALGKITQATKDVTWNQFGMIAALTGLLGATVAGLAFISPLIFIGSAALMTMSISLLIYGIALGKITSATKGLNIEGIELVADSMWTLGKEIAWLALLAGPIAIGSISVGIMGRSLYKFAKALKKIKDMGGVPVNEVEQVLESIKSIGEFYKDNELDADVIIESYKYKKMLKPFTDTVKQLNKLKKMEGVPLELVYQTLNAMGAIGLHYMLRPIPKFVIDLAKRYKKMMKPFGNTVKHLAKLKEMGKLPIELVYQTLNAMSAIGEYYLNNPIEKKVIKQAKRYKRMMKPFGTTVENLVKLKQMGKLPIELVYQTLNAMSAIGEYYINNPIEKKVIKQAKRYKKMMKPFGTTVENLVKLKQMGKLPMELVYQTLDSMYVIGQYYLNNPIDGDVIDEAENYQELMEPFGSVVEMLSKLKEIKGDPSTTIRSVVLAMSDIAWFYETTKIGDWSLVELTSEYTKFIVDKFTDMSGEIIDKFVGIQPIDSKAVLSIVTACRHIIRFYNRSWFSKKTKKRALRMNTAIKSFALTADEIKNKLSGFTESDADNIGFAIKGMRKIIRFLRWNSLGPLERIRARKNIKLLQDMSAVVTNISGVKSSNISSVGSALTSALEGVNTIDLGQVQAVTNMFNAFNEINKSENIINKFTESIDNFTEACNNLLDAMGNNTDAINNMDAGGGGGLMGNIGGGGLNKVIETTADEDGNQTSGIRISNVEDIARNIADKINGSLSIEIPDTQIQLLINGAGGNEWTITRY